MPSWYPLKKGDLALVGGFPEGGHNPLEEKAPIGRGQFSALGTAVSH